MNPIKRLTTYLRWRHGWTKDQWAALWIAVLILIGAALVSGCQSAQMPPASRSTAASLAGAEQNIRATTRAITAAKPHSNPTGNAILDMGMESANAGLVNIQQGKAENDWFVGAYWSTVNELNYVKAGWGYRLQQFVRRMAWIIGGSVLIGFILMAVNPLGWGGTIGKIVFLFLPKMFATPLEAGAAGVHRVLIARRK